MYQPKYSFRYHSLSDKTEVSSKPNIQFKLRSDCYSAFENPLAKHQYLALTLLLDEMEVSNKISVQAML